MEMEMPWLKVDAVWDGDLDDGGISEWTTANE